jgi:hypothetical protein
VCNKTLYFLKLFCIVSIVCILLLLPGNGMLVDAYIFQLAMYTELNCNNIYPPGPVWAAMEIKIVGSYLHAPSAPFFRLFHCLLLTFIVLHAPVSHYTMVYVHRGVLLYGGSDSCQLSCQTLSFFRLQRRRDPACPAALHHPLHPAGGWHQRDAQSLFSLFPTQNQVFTPIAYLRTRNGKP